MRDTGAPALTSGVGVATVSGGFKRAFEYYSVFALRVALQFTLYTPITPTPVPPLAPCTIAVYAPGGSVM